MDKAEIMKSPDLVGQLPQRLSFLQPMSANVSNAVPIAEKNRQRSSGDRKSQQEGSLQDAMISLFSSSNNWRNGESQVGEHRSRSQRAQSLGRTAKVFKSCQR